MVVVGIAAGDRHPQVSDSARPLDRCKGRRLTRFDRDVGSALSTGSEVTGCRSAAVDGSVRVLGSYRPASFVTQFG